MVFVPEGIRYAMKKILWQALMIPLGIDGTDIRSDASKSRVENWLKRIGLDKE